MGLEISVGILCDQAQNDPEGLEYHRGGFDRLTRALAAEGIDWREPEILHEARDDHDFSAGFPYSYLAHLRRVYTLARLGEPVTPSAATSAEQYDRDQVKVADEMTMFASHLLCHADNEGYYIPVDFADPLFLPEEAEVAGAGMVGSSQRLLAELTEIAAPIGIELDADGVLSRAEAASLEATAAAPDGDAFAEERFVWSQMYQACLASIESGHAIVFC